MTTRLEFDNVTIAGVRDTPPNGWSNANNGASKPAGIQEAVEKDANF